MANKPTLKKIEQIANNEEAAVALFNDNFNTLEEVIKDSVSRSGKVPTNMLDNLDMGDKRIINLGKAVGDNDAVRYKDVKDALKESQNAKKFAQNAENAAVRADASAALSDISKKEAQKAEAGAKQSEDNAQMIYDELITNEAVATVHENIEDVKAVAADIDNVNTTADNMEDIKAVFDIAKRISYGNIGDISATAASIPPDGCRFLNGSAITREEFPDAFKMLDEGTLPFKSVAEWGKSAVSRNYLVLGTLDSAYDEASGLVKSSDGISIFPITIPKTFSSFRIRASFEMPTVPTDEESEATVSILDSRFFDIVYGKRSTAVVDNQYADFKYSLTSEVAAAREKDGAIEKTQIVESYWRDGDDPIVRLEANTRYFIDATITNADGVWKLEYHVYASDGVSEIAFRDLEMNGESLKASTLLDFSVEKEDVKLSRNCVWNLPETKIWLDGSQIYQGKKAVFTGNNPYFGFDAGSNVAYLPVAKDIFLEAGDVHAALVSAGLPNLYGQTVTGAENHGTEYANGIFSISTVNNTYRNTGGDYGRATLITADASRASTIYGNSDTVQPEALKYRHYIVLSHREQMIFTMRDSVKAYKDLPKTGNINGDIRMVTDQGVAYIWCRYSRDVWGWSSIGQYLTITAPGKFAWGALGGDLRKQTDLYSRLNIPALAVAGEGIKFEEEREKNFEEFRRAVVSAEGFEYSEDGTHLLKVPQYGALKMDKINLNENFTASLRLKVDTRSSTMIYPLSIGLNSNIAYLYIRNVSGSDITQFYMYTRSGYIAVVVPFAKMEDYVDVVISFEHPTPSTVLLNLEVHDMSGNVLAKPNVAPTEKGWTSISATESLYLGNRPSGTAAALDMDLTNTWLEQNGARYYALKVFEEPRTKISIEDLNIIQKNKAKSSYSLILGSSEDDSTKAYRTGYNAERIEQGGSAFGYSSVADVYGTAIGYNAEASIYSAQIGEGFSEAFELGFGEHGVIDCKGKLYKDRLPLAAGEGITFTNTSGNSYRLIGNATVEEGLLRFGKEKHIRSCLVSSWSGFDPQDYLEFQIALKDVPAGTVSYSGSYDYLLRSYIINDGVVEEDGTRYFRAPYLYYSNSKDSGYTRIYYYGFFVGGYINTEDFNSGDILIKETLIDKVVTLQYSKDDGVTWNTLKTQTIEETQTAMGAWTMLLGQPEKYSYVSNANFTGSIDLNKSFLYLASNHNTNLLVEGAKRPANELVISANIPEDIGGAKALEDIAVAGEGITFAKNIERYEVVGSAVTVSEDYVASGFTGSSSIKHNIDAVELSKGFAMETAFTVSSLTPASMIMRINNASNSGLARISTNAAGRVTAVIGSSTSIMSVSSFSAGDKVYVRVVYDGSTLFLYISSNGKEWSLENSRALDPTSTDIAGSIATSTTVGINATVASIDLKACAVSSQDKEVWRAVETKTQISANVPEVDLTGYLKNSTNTDLASLVVVPEGTTVTQSGAKDQVAIGSSSVKLSGSGATAFGAWTEAKGSGATALGFGAKAQAARAIQIANGVNTEPNTCYVGLSDTLNVKLLDANGQIPTERLTNVLGDIETLLAAL